MDGAMLQGVLIDKAIKVLFQRACHFGWPTGAGTIEQALGALVGKAIDPLAEGGIGTCERLGDGVQTGPFDDFTDRWSATEDPGLFCLFQHRIQSGEGVIGKVELEGPHGRALSYKVLHKYENMSHHIV
jgi:hypothetical protein